MRNYIMSTFGTKVLIEKYNLPLNAPMYLKIEYSYCKYLIAGQECLFAKPVNFTLPGYKKHMKKLTELTGMFVVAELDRITPYQRKALIEECIPFVVKGIQLYLPFLGISLTERYTPKTEIEKFAPITQLVFLYIFYNHTKMTATEISKKLNCTIMSATRAYKALTECGLFSYDCRGRNKYIVANKEGGELLKAAEQYMIDPVDRVRYYRNMFNDDFCAAGLYALGKKTMLSISESDKCYAVSKDYKFDSGKLISDIEYMMIGGVKIQQWSYNPGVLAQNNAVDDISLILTLKNTTDERALLEIERLRSKYEW